MLIERACANDLPAVEALYAEAIDAMRNTPFDIWWEMGMHPTADGLARAQEAGNLFVARDGARMLGAFVLDAREGADYTHIPWRVDAAPGAVAVLHLLAVAPAARGQGVARALVTAAAEEARHRGAEALRLDVFSNNTPARALYQTLGFADICETDIHVGGGLVHASHLMELDLRGDVAHA